MATFLNIIKIVSELIIESKKKINNTAFHFERKFMATSGVIGSAMETRLF